MRSDVILRFLFVHRHPQKGSARKSIYKFILLYHSSKECKYIIAGVPELGKRGEAHMRIAFSAQSC
jgi:hypothetical protein